MLHEIYVEQATQKSLYTPTVLIIDDEKAVRRFLYIALSAHGYLVYEASTGQSGMKQIIDRQPDLILLDMDLPDMKGIDITKTVREWSQVPILIVSSRNHDVTKAEILDAGADDYIVKPFSLSELMARMRVAIRHTPPLPCISVFSLGDLYIDVVARIIKMRNQTISLTPTEYDILLYLVQHVGKVITYQQLWGQIRDHKSKADTHLIRVHISNLRHKLERDPAHPYYILTESGVGYRLRAISS